MSKRMLPLLTTFALSLIPAVASAHVSVASGPGFANVSQEISFGVGHGCDGADTMSVTIDLPAGVTSVRPMRSDFGRVAVTKDMAGAVTAVTWEKADADVLPADLAFYKLTIRMKLPNTPFTTLNFPAHQTCKGPDGGTIVVDWVATTPQNPDAGMTAEPAPALLVLPARKPGWNRYTVPAAVADVATFFSDAQIVWKGTAAFSSNANTTALIGTTPGVTALTSLAANDEVWVKY